MLLVIHNLPKLMRYEEVKDLIRDRCHLTDIIVDNLVLETTLTRKVTIGLADENDAAIVFKELNGLVLGGRKIIVEDLRKQKESGNRYKPLLAQDNNMMQSSFEPYSSSSGSNYPFNSLGNMQNTQIPYHGVPSPFENNQQQVGGSTSIDFIPLNSGNSNYDGGKNDRYFNWEGNNQRPTSDVRGGNSSYSNEGNYADWNRNRSDEYPIRSDSNNAGDSSVRDPFKWNKGNDCLKNDEKPASPRFGNNYSRQYDNRRKRDDSYDRSAKRSKHSQFEKPSARNDFGSGYSGQNKGNNHRERSGVPDQGYNNRMEQKPNVKTAPYSGGQDYDQPRGATIIRSAPWSQPKNFPPPKVHKTVNALTAIKNKDETWRGQAVSAIVKGLLVENGMQEDVKKQCLLSYLKPIVRSQVDQMLGKRVAVPMPEIIEQYKRENPPHRQREFIIEERKKYEFTRYDSGDINQEELDAAVSQLNAQFDIKPYHLVKKEKKGQPAPKHAKPPVMQDNKEAVKLKRLEKTNPDIYDDKLGPKLKSALDNELGIICDIFRAECRKTKVYLEMNVLNRIQDVVGLFRKELKLNISKRILNIMENLPLKAFTEERVNSKEIKAHLKSLGIVTFRKCLGRNKYVATCRTFEQYDYFCEQSTFVINGQKITFRPLHTGRPPRNQNSENDDNEEDYGEEYNDESLDEFDQYEDDESDIDEDQKDDKKGIFFKNYDAKASEYDTAVVKSEPGEDTKVEVPNYAEETEVSKVNIKTGNVEVKMDTAYENKAAIKETAESEEKKERVVDEMDNAETAKLYQEIQALSKNINEEIDIDWDGGADNKYNTVDIKTENECFEQDDLEDF